RAVNDISPARPVPAVEVLMSVPSMVRATLRLDPEIVTLPPWPPLAPTLLERLEFCRLTSPLELRVIAPALALTPTARTASLDRVLLLNVTVAPLTIGCTVTPAPARKLEDPGADTVPPRMEISPALAVPVVVVESLESVMDTETGLPSMMMSPP